MLAMRRWRNPARSVFSIFFIPTRVVGTPGRLTWDEIAAMQRAGMRFGSHSLTHAWLTRLRLADARREIAESKTELESHLGVPANVFAYPYGAASPQVTSLVQAAGYMAALGTSPPRLKHTLTQRYYLTRLGVYRGMTLAAFAARLEDGTRSVPTSPLRPVRIYHRWNPDD
jgi:peptidoglycan/xylan/chitin deacetylase (PgdA/CDA1 family)